MWNGVAVGLVAFLAMAMAAVVLFSLATMRRKRRRTNRSNAMNGGDPPRNDDDIEVAVMPAGLGDAVLSDLSGTW